MTIKNNIEKVNQLKNEILRKSLLVDGITECKRYYTVDLLVAIPAGYNQLAAIRACKSKGKLNALQLIINKLNNVNI
jgi:hypothetical protein